MRVLHLASFSGNIGDNASHQGLYRILEQIINTSEIKELEIRNFYKNATGPSKRYFDKTFVDECNSYDLVIFGGGGYLDYWVPNSETGTTFDISFRFLEAIKTPFLLTSLGCVPGKEVPPGNKKKFIDFLDFIANRKNWYLMLRNDGSTEHLKNELGFRIPDNFDSILDNGFFYENYERNPILSSKPYIAMNISDDQISMSGISAVSMKSENYYDSIGKLITSLIDLNNINIFLIPHIYGDLIAINSILNRLSEEHLRHKVLIGPCLTRNNGADIIFSIYKNSLFSIGNRFHANVCSIAMDKNSIGLSALQRIESMYDSIDLSNSYVVIKDGFEEHVLRKSEKLITSNQECIVENMTLENLKHKSIESYIKALSYLNIL